MKLTKKMRKRFVVESYCSCNSYCGKDSKLNGSQGGMATKGTSTGPCP